MATSQTARADIENKIDAVLEQEQTALTEQARAALRARFEGEERIALAAKEHAKLAAARAAFEERVQAAHQQACVEYKTAVDAFRAARIRLHALDTILDRVGFSTHHLGTEMRHAIAAPDEGDIHHAYERAVASVRKTLGG
jgi:hypothetical protein